jgi:serine/threonine protein kinase
MDDGATQPNIRQRLDSRRVERNASGLNDDNDVADIMCTLYPSSPAASQIVALTAQRKPQHILQNASLVSFADGAPKHILEEHGTAQDLALRFSSDLVQPVLGFTFGRNPQKCDIVFSIDSIKRTSNLHFRIYVIHAGIIMLEDMSTNGTMVGNRHLKGKSGKGPATRMLTQGEVIQIPSTKPEEVIKFIVCIPLRDRYESAYLQNFQAFRQRMDIADAEHHQRGLGKPVLTTGVASGNPFKMHWNGGDDYNIVDLLGKGVFAIVYQLASKIDGELFAAKEFEKKRFIKNGQLDQQLDNEIQIMKDLRHPNIVRYIDYRDEGAGLYIIMEYVPIGDLQDYLQTYGLLEEPAARLMAYQTLKALRYLHRKKIIHRNISPDNILIANTNPWTIKLSGFGLSTVVKNNETFPETFCGTLLYCAPEVFPYYNEYIAKQGTKRRRGYSQSVDIWSFAAVLWFALCGKAPFEGIVHKIGKKMFDRIIGTQLDVSPLRARGISEAATDLLCQMLNTNPSERPSETECLQHPWLAGLDRDSDSDAEMEDDLHPIAEEPQEKEEEAKDPSVAGPSIDSGYGSMLPRKFSHWLDQHKLEQHAQAHIAMIKEQPEDYDTDTDTAYSEVISLQGFDILGYISEFADELSSSLPPDFGREDFDRLSPIFEDILKEFAVRIGHQQSNETKMHRHIMHLVHKHRG